MSMSMVMEMCVGGRWARGCGRGRDHVHGHHILHHVLHLILQPACCPLVGALVHWSALSVGQALTNSSRVSIALPSALSVARVSSSTPAVSIFAPSAVLIVAKAPIQRTDMDALACKQTQNAQHTSLSQNVVHVL
jgi:hypothetical protein